MNRKITWLSGLLAVQLALFAVLALTTSRLAGGPPGGGAWLEGDTARIDAVTIEGADGQRVALRKADGRWTLPDEGGFPADGERVDALLKRLAAIRTGAPVSSSAEARTRFRVADEAFERRVTLSAGDAQVAKLYVGNGASTRAAYVRRDGDDAVYEAALATHELPAGGPDWEDKGVLRFAAEDIRSIEVDGLTLTREAAKDEVGATAATWQASGLAQGQTLKTEAADELARLISGLSIGRVLGREDKPEYGLARPALALGVTRADGRRIDYHLGAPAPGGDPVLKASSREEYFSVASYVAEPLRNAAKREALVQAAGGAR